MWNRIPRLLRVRLFAVFASVALLFPFQTASAARPLAPAAATCGDVVINEVLFNASADYGDEWVELHVVNTLPAGTVLKVKDNENPGAHDFFVEFTLVEEILADRYIVIHAKDETDSQEPTAGTLNIFNAGDGNGDLNNENENIGLYVFGGICEEVYWESGAGANAPAFAAPSTSVFTGSSNIINGESIARSPNGPDGQFVRGTTDGLYNATDGQSIGRNNDDGTLSVTVGYFQTIRKQGAVYFTWQTATEAGNAGFNLLAETPDGAVLLNSALIASTVIDSVTPTDYSYTANTDADHFYIQEVGIDGQVDNIGPFALGETVGVYSENSSLSQEEQAEPILFLPLVQAQ